jgi:hypothetical protein
LNLLLTQVGSELGQVHVAQDLRRWSTQRVSSQVLFPEALHSSLAASFLCSESTWQNILKSVFATVASISQFVRSQGIDDVADRLQGLIDGVIENSITNQLQLHPEASTQKLHPETSNESPNERSSGNK